MKIYLTYGLAIAGAGFLLNLILFFTGFQTDADRLGTAQTIATVVGIAITVVGLVLATKARRAEVPLSEDFGYGRALGAAVMTAIFATIAGVILNQVYVQLINPGMPELLVQHQIDGWEAAGMSASQIEGAEGMMRKMMHPAVQVGFGLVMGIAFGTIIGLITSAFLRRPATAPVPPAVA